MGWKLFKYILPLLLFAGALHSFSNTGFIVWLPIIIAFVLIPVIELLIPPDDSNLSAAEEEIAKKERIYDWLLYTIVPLQYICLFYFLNSLQQPDLSLADKAGRTMVMGLLCGIFGINVAHELGHRIKKGEQFLAKSLLLTSLYMNFFIEHNRGHHKHVGTPYDPSTARMNEPLYLFWFRSISGVYIRAWKIASEEQRKKGKGFLHNEMLHYQILEIAFCILIGVVFSGTALLYFLAAALIGILLLETVNYIEHYGLMRKPLDEGKYERAMPEHSWNSNHVVGRLMLFELSRHSDHHYLASRKYQLLRHHDDSPQLPTGYPGSMLLAMASPIWFAVMNKKIKKGRYS
jgi:alkane 1-monooxygenase